MAAGRARWHAGRVDKVEIQLSFAPELQQMLQAVEKEAMRGQLPGGTERTYDGFAKCADCGQAYWRGAHFSRLNGIVEQAVRRHGA